MNHELTKTASSFHYEGPGAAWVCLLMGWIGLTCLQYTIEFGPPIKLNRHSENEFLAENAHRLLEQFFLESKPHPVDSEALGILRNQLINQLNDWGYDVEIQETEALTRMYLPPGEEKRVSLSNIIFRLNGTAPDAAANTILLLSHYDSTPLGPGVSDDAVGFAVWLQIARQLKQGPPPRNNIVFLITDGEEAGLLGAKKFVEEHPLANEVALVVNLEARGTSGRSLMFQTSPQNRWLISLMGKALSRPATSSLFQEIYKRLPNDTDFTIFLLKNKLGYNFAYIGDAQNYHTPNDNLVNSSFRSLAHHGRNVWELTNALANQPLELSEQGDAVYFDLCGRWLIWWPADWTIPIAGVSLLLAAFGCLALRPSLLAEQQRVTGIWTSPVAFSVSACLGLCVLVVALNYGLLFEKATQVQFPKSGFGFAGGLWGAGIAIALAISTCFHVEPRRMFAMIVVLWNLAAVASSIFFVGASYLFVVPAVCGSFLLLMTRCWRRKELDLSAAVAFSMVVAVMWLTIEILFYEALGTRSFWLIAPKATIAATTWLPILGEMDKKVGRALALIAALAAIILLVTGVATNRLV